MSCQRRVVVTGLGCVSPLGVDVKASWSKLLEGVSGLSYAGDSEPFLNTRSKVIGRVPIGIRALDGSVLDLDCITKKEIKRVGSFANFAVYASMTAIEDSGFGDFSSVDKTRVGVSIGSGIGGLYEIDKSSVELRASGKVSPFFIVSALANLASSAVSILYGLEGPLVTHTAACATGNYSISGGLSMIRNGEVDVVIAGSAERPICNLGVAGFDVMRALSSSFNDTPEKASRPWDQDRDGFVISEGSGILVLEEYEHAKKRGAKIYAEVLGHGFSSDSYHVSAPHPEGRGAFLAMQKALEDANLPCEKISYINAHGTSTQLGDFAEVVAIKELFGDHAYKMPVSSIKSSIGHSLGGAGSIEAVFSILSIADNAIPPTLNLDNPQEGCDLDFVPFIGKQHKIDYVLSNSFGFGGINASIIFGRI